MEIGAYVTILALAAAVGILACKIAGMRKAAREIADQFRECCQEETNALISISSRDGSMRKLAEEINGQLRGFRSQRHRFSQGDRELKEAVTNISHDLRTPLTAISGYLELLGREEQSAQSRRWLGLIENRTAALKQLTEELFRYSIILSVQENTPERVELQEALEESLAAAYSLLRMRGITPQIHLPEDRVERIADRSALLRIFGNVIQNAVKYSEGDFRIVMDSNGKIIFSNQASGLNPVSAARLFDRFYTVESQETSTGLGLSIARTLTERQGGSIRARYEEGRLSVILEFPDQRPRSTSLQ